MHAGWPMWFSDPPFNSLLYRLGHRRIVVSPLLISAHSSSGHSLDFCIVRGGELFPSYSQMQRVCLFRPLNQMYRLLTYPAMMIAVRIGTMCLVSFPSRIAYRPSSFLCSPCSQSSHPRFFSFSSSTFISALPLYLGFHPSSSHPSGPRFSDSQAPSSFFLRVSPRS